MQIRRDSYIEKLERLRNNGRVKIITGLRRSGKSYLLFTLYKEHLIRKDIKEDQIIELALDEIENNRYRNPFALNDYFVSRITDKSRQYYLFIDEIQFCKAVDNPDNPGTDDRITFVDTAISLSRKPNVDLYITGSNSRMLSKDIMTQFRDRGDEVHVFPLSFSEFYEACQDKQEAWIDYITHGGMPYTLQLGTHEEKSKYLKNLFELTYLKDIIERNGLAEKDKAAMDILLDFLSSSVGSLTNPTKLENRFRSEARLNVSHAMIAGYLGFLEEAYLIAEAKRYDIKGSRYFNTPLKYYFSDIGLRNARLNFRQTEENHLMENVIYNELISRGYDVDVGVIEKVRKNSEGKSERAQLEVDFVINSLSQKIYIQSALTTAEEEKREQEIRPLLQINDSFKKVVITKDKGYPWFDRNGVYFINIQDFLLNRDSLVF